jgi:hypothetical protein
MAVLQQVEAGPDLRLHWQGREQGVQQQAEQEAAARQLWNAGALEDWQSLCQCAVGVHLMQLAPPASSYLTMGQPDAMGPGLHLAAPLVCCHCCCQTVVLRAVYQACCLGLLSWPPRTHPAGGGVRRRMVKPMLARVPTQSVHEVQSYLARRFPFP